MSHAPTALDFHPPARLPSYWPWVVGSVLTAFLIVSLLPLWTVWYVGQWGSTADELSLWKALGELFSGRAKALHGVWFEYGEIVSLTLVVGAAIGALYVHSTRVVMRRNEL